MGQAGRADAGGYSYGYGAWFEHPTALGSTATQTDYAGGLDVDMTFYPWGQIWNQAGPIHGDIRFAGFQYPEWQFGPLLYPTNTRKYNPSLSRWLSPDPLAGDVTNPQSLNRYAYAGNNPVSLTDPTGLCGETYTYTLTDAQGNVTQQFYDIGEACYFLTEPWNIPGLIIELSSGTYNNGSGGGGSGGSSSGKMPDISKTWSKTVACTSDATQLMSAVQADMGRFADNPVGPFVAKFPDQPIQMGGKYDINAGLFVPSNRADAAPFYANDLRVTVTAQTPNAWVFTTDPAHHYFNGTIAFIASNAGNGNVTFSITASANFTGFFNKYVLGSIIKAGENSTWNNLLGNVQSYCSSGGVR